MQTALSIAACAALAAALAYKACTAPFSDVLGSVARARAAAERREARSKGRERRFKRLGATLGSLLPLSPRGRERTREELLSAGIALDPVVWHGLALAAGAAGGAAGAALAAVADAGAAGAAFAAVGAASGWGAARAWLSARRSARKKAVEAKLPAAIELLRIVAAAGLPIDRGFKEVAGMRAELGPVAEEFGRVHREVSLVGMDRAEALAAMAERCGTVEMGSFCSAMIQAAKQGTAVDRVLRSQSAAARKAHFDRCRERVNKVSVWISVPLGVFFLPCAFVLLVAPLVPEIMGFLGSMS